MWLENWTIMLFSTQVVVAVDVKLVNDRHTLVAWFTTFLVGHLVSGGGFAGGWVLKVRTWLSQLSTKM